MTTRLKTTLIALLTSISLATPATSAFARLVHPTMQRPHHHHHHHAAKLHRSNIGDPTGLTRLKLIVSVNADGRSRY